MAAWHLHLAPGSAGVGGAWRSEPCPPQASWRQQAQVGPSSQNGPLLPEWAPSLPHSRHHSTDSWSSINAAISVEVGRS